MKLDQKKFPGLTKVLADVSDATKLKQALMKETGKAVEALYNLDIDLSKMHRGVPQPEQAPQPWDVHLGELRKKIRAALDELKSYDLFDLVDKMYGDKDV